MVRPGLGAPVGCLFGEKERMCRKKERGKEVL